MRFTCGTVQGKLPGHRVRGQAAGLRRLRPDPGAQRAAVLGHEGDQDRQQRSGPPTPRNCKQGLLHKPSKPCAAPDGFDTGFGLGQGSGLG